MGIKHAETGSHRAILYFPWRSAEKVTALPLDTLSSAANRMKRVHTMEKWSGLKAAELPSTQDNLISKSITSWWTSPGYIGTGVVLGRTLGLLLCACLSNASKRQISSFMIFKKGGQNNCFPIHHFRNRPFHTSDSAQLVQPLLGSHPVWGDYLHVSSHCWMNTRGCSGHLALTPSALCAVSPFHICVWSLGGQELNLTYPGFPETLPSVQHRLLNAKATCEILFILQNLPEWPLKSEVPWLSFHHPDNNNNTTIHWLTAIEHFSWARYCAEYI